MNKIQIFVTGGCLAFSGLIFAACGAEDSGAGATEPIGQVEEEATVGQACGALNPCTDGSTCCSSGRDAFCRDLNWDESNCGSCGHPCGAGTECNAGACIKPCFYHQDCPSSQICLAVDFYGVPCTSEDNPGWDLSGCGLYVTEHGRCGSKTCTVNSDCTQYEAAGVISGWGATDGVDNTLRCFGGHCVAAASDPLHCGPNNNNTSICSQGYQTCMTYNNVAVGCGGAGKPACPHSKSTPGYWRDCP